MMAEQANMSAAHILVIDDDERLRDLLQRFLAESGFLVTAAGSAEEARAFLVGTVFDLLVIDVMMPGETGTQFLADLRKQSAVPALFLTAINETEDRIAGLETGADDYIAKPFEPRELILRIKRILERQKLTEKQSLVQFGLFSYDTDSQILMEDGLRVHITTAEQDLLKCFTAAPDSVLSRHDISNSLKGRMNGRSIDVAVARLRTKLERDPRFPRVLADCPRKRLDAENKLTGDL